MKTINLLLLLFLFSINSLAQPASYQLKTSTKTYAPAASLQKISPENFADDLTSFNIQFPFAFEIEGTQYDSAILLREGGLLFTTPTQKIKHAIVGLGALLTAKDSTTGIYTETTGAVGSRSFIIEYRWFGVEGGIPADYTNFSITLFEGSNEFEINYGLHSNFDTSLYSLKKGPIVGLFNQDTINTQETLASCYLTDKPQNPTFNFNTISDTVPFSLCGHVPHNTSYRFVAASTTTVKKISGNENFTVYPNPIYGESMTVKFAEADNYTIGLNDLNGRIIRQFYSTGTDNVKLDIEGVKSGVYFLNIATNTKVLPQRKIMIN